MKFETGLVLTPRSLILLRASLREASVACATMPEALGPYGGVIFRDHHGVTETRSQMSRYLVRHADKVASNSVPCQ